VERSRYCRTRRTELWRAVRFRPIALKWGATAGDRPDGSPFFFSINAQYYRPCLRHALPLENRYRTAALPKHVLADALLLKVPCFCSSSDFCTTQLRRECRFIQLAFGETAEDDATTLRTLGEKKLNKWVGTWLRCASWSCPTINSLGHIF
jgi:hypothetical protein